MSTHSARPSRPATPHLDVAVSPPACAAWARGKAVFDPGDAERMGTEGVEWGLEGDGGREAEEVAEASEEVLRPLEPDRAPHLRAAQRHLSQLGSAMAAQRTMSSRCAAVGQARLP
jgi:hypothetical protein